MIKRAAVTEVYSMANMIVHRQRYTTEARRQTQHPALLLLELAKILLLLLLLLLIIIIIIIMKEKSRQVIRNISKL